MFGSMYTRRHGAGCLGTVAGLLLFCGMARAAEPPIQIPFELNEPGFVTLVIDDAQGKRVRNLVSETPFPAGRNIAYWDGLDDLGRDPQSAERGEYHIPGRLVSPGAYRVRGLVRKQIDLRYQMAVYNPGNPPWNTADPASNWFSNHSPPQGIAFVPAGRGPFFPLHPSSSGPQIIVGSHISEGTSGVAWLDTEGKKIHGQNWVGGNWTGAQFLAADTGDNPLADTYVYTGSVWEETLRLNRFRTGGPVQGQQGRLSDAGDAPALQPNYAFPDRDHAQLGGLAARNGVLVASLTKMNQLLFVDVAANRAIGTLAIDDPRGIAFDKQGRLLIVSGKRLLRYTLPDELTDYLTPADRYGVRLDKSKWKIKASHRDFEAHHAIDGNLKTGWGTNAPQALDQWIVLDLGQEETFTSLMLISPFDYAHGFDIFISNDGVDFGQPVVSVQGLSGQTTATFPPLTARYIKLAITKPWHSRWLVMETELFNKESTNDADGNSIKSLPEPEVIGTDLEDPQNITLDAQGNIYVGDLGTVHQVKVYAPSPGSSASRAIGKPGIPKAGPYDPERMNNPAGLAIDDRHRLWVAEHDAQPRRVSVWDAATGQLLNVYYGPQVYGGGGEVDARDPNQFHYQGMTFALDWDKQASHPINVFYRPTPNEQHLPGEIPQKMIYVGDEQFVTNAYSSSPTNGAEVVGIWQMRDGVAIPVAAAGDARQWPALNFAREFSVRWSGQIQPPESGTYSISLEVGNAAKVLLDGKPIITYAGNNGQQELKADVTFEAGKRYDFQVELVKAPHGSLYCKLFWAPPGQGKRIIPSESLFAALDATRGEGLKAEYFRNTDFTDPILTRNESVNFYAEHEPPKGWALPELPGLAERLPPKTYLATDPLFFIWTDDNGDGTVQMDEVQFATEKGNGNAVGVMPDLSFVVSNWNGKAMLFKPSVFENGRPKYNLSEGVVLASGTQRPASSGGGEAMAADNGWTVLTTPPQPFAPEGLGGAKDGKPMWSYPSLWPGLHPSHRAPVPERPGEIIGSTRLMGHLITPKGGEAGPIFTINGNKGNAYMMTVDGLFVATLFKDSRLKQWNMTAATRDMLVNDASQMEEDFWPTITQLPDGRVFITTVSSCIVRVDGLESIRRLPETELTVTEPMLAAVGKYFVEQEAARQRANAAKAGPLTVAKMTPTPDGKLDEWDNAKFVTIDKAASAAIAIDDKYLYAAFKTGDSRLLQNSGESLQNLFKCGGALDIMLGNVPGGQRIVVAQVKDRTVAMLYRTTDPQSPAEQHARFTSNIGLKTTVQLDRVQDVSAQIQLATDGKGNFEVAIPRSLLKLTTAPTTFKGDVGVLRGNGFQTVQRVYWANKMTGLVSDLASEAQLSPQLWGDWRTQ